MERYIRPIETEMASDEKNEISSSLSNKSGIPQAVFVEDVDSYMQQSDNASAETVLRRLDEQHQKYKFMEMNLNTKKKRLKSQIPDIKSTLNTVRELASNKQETMNTHFMLADNLFVKARIPPTDTVCLWLGANVMLEYSLEEAEALLVKNFEQAKTALDVVDEDLGFLRDQTTTTEVSMARIYNWDVKRRQKLQKPSSAESEADS